MTAKDQYTNEGWHGKYFTVMLNMADDDLGPFEYRLLGHFIRVCGANKTGKCYQTVRTIAEITRISIPKIISTRDELAKKGWIRIKHRPNKSHQITVIDRMAENIARYGDQNIEQSSQNQDGDQNIDHGDQNIDHGDQYPAYKEQPVKNNHEEMVCDQGPAVQPHIAIIDAWYDGMPAAPISRQYARNVRVSKAILDKGYTPEQVKMFVVAKYQDKYWQDKQMTLEFVERDLPQWVAANYKPPAPPAPKLSDDEKRAAIAEMFELPTDLAKAG